MDGRVASSYWQALSAARTVQFLKQDLFADDEMVRYQKERVDGSGSHGEGVSFGSLGKRLRRIPLFHSSGCGLSLYVCAITRTDSGSRSEDRTPYSQNQKKKVPMSSAKYLCMTESLLTLD